MNSSGIDVGEILRHAALELPDGVSEQKLHREIERARKAFHKADDLRWCVPSGQKMPGVFADLHDHLAQVSVSDLEAVSRQIDKTLQTLVGNNSLDAAASEQAGGGLDGPLIRVLEQSAATLMPDAAPGGRPKGGIRRTVHRLMAMRMAADHAKRLRRAQEYRPPKKGERYLARLLARSYMAVWGDWPRIDKNAPSDGIRFIRTAAQQVFQMDLSEEAVVEYIGNLCVKAP